MHKTRARINNERDKLNNQGLGEHRHLPKQGLGQNKHLPKQGLGQHTHLPKQSLSQHRHLPKQDLSHNCHNRLIGSAPVVFETLSEEIIRGLRIGPPGRGLVLVFAVLGWFLAEVGPKAPLHRPGSKNGAERM